MTPTTMFTTTEESYDYPKTELVSATNLTSNDDLLVYPYLDGIDLGGFSGDSDSFGFDQEVEMPMLVIRAPLVPSGENLEELTGIEDYKITVFEFQDYYKKEYRKKRRQYGASITIVDNTKLIADKIEELLLSSLTDLALYLELARNLCAVNDITGEFNNFFAEAMLDIYKDSPAAAPWYVAPTMFVSFKDLVFDSFQGDKDSLAEHALAIVEKISPYGGTVENIQSFYDSMYSLYDELYKAPDNIDGGDSYINSILEDFDLERELNYTIARRNGELWPEVVTSTFVVSSDEEVFVSDDPSYEVFEGPDLDEEDEEDEEDDDDRYQGYHGM